MTNFDLMLITGSEALGMSNDMLVNALVEYKASPEDVAGFRRLSIRNILNEMRHRVFLEQHGRTGYTGCTEKFSEYIG